MRKLLIVVIFAILSIVSYAEDGKWSHMMDTVGYDMNNEEIPVEIGILDDEILVIKFPCGYPEEITEIMLDNECLEFIHKGSSFYIKITTKQLYKMLHKPCTLSMDMVWEICLNW